MTSVGMTRIRVALGIVGVAIGLVGVYAFVAAVPTRQRPGGFIWLGGVVVAHDAVVAPAAVLLGLAVFAVAPLRLRAPMRVAVLGFASLLLIGVPVLITR